MNSNPENSQTDTSAQDMQSPAVGLGMAALGRPDYINLAHGRDIRDRSFEAMRKHAFVMLDQAYEMGIRYFDTATSYGAGEIFLGEWVFDRGYQNGGVIVASKWGYRYTADWKPDAGVHEVKDHSLGNLQQSYIWSCLRLGQAMRVYQIHSATFESGVLQDNAVLEEMARVKQSGRLVGVTVTGARQRELIEKVLQTELDGQRLFDALQVTWNLMEQSTSAVLEEAHDAGMKVIVKECLANGRLTDRNRQSGFRKSKDILHGLASRYACTIEELAMAVVFSRPWASIVLSGAATIEQLQSSVKAKDIDVEDGLIDALGEIRETPEAYWRAREDLVWN